MAKQSGILRIEGTIAGISFYKTADGYFAREKSSLSRKRIYSDPSFQRTRENASEFGTAARMSKILIDVVRPVLKGSGDRRLFSRLVKTILAIIKKDKTNIRGSRVLAEENVKDLVGFDFNLNADIRSVVNFGIDKVQEKSPTERIYTFSKFRPIDAIKFPPGATHFKLAIMLISGDWLGETRDAATGYGKILPLNEEEISPEIMIKPLAKETKHEMVLLGIEFMQEVNGNYYSLKDGGYVSLSVLSFGKNGSEGGQVAAEV